MKNNTYVIAEVAQAHDGSLGTAYSYIDAVAKSGANAIKFQTHFADEESTYDEPWRVKFSKQDKYRFDYWKRLEFTEDQWLKLKKYTIKKKLDFISSPFSIKAAKLLKKINVKYWKIASGEVHNSELLNFCFKDKKPILISTGLIDDTELYNLSKKLKKNKKDFAFFHCVSRYPTEPEYWNLNKITTLRKKFNCKIGYSDHSGNIISSLSAATIGVDFIEIHVTFDKSSFGPDTKSSINMKQLKDLVDGVRQIDISKEYKYKDKSKSKNKLIFSRSLALKNPMKKGSVLTLNDLTLKKPGTGIKYNQITKIIGKKLKINKSNLYLLKKKDLQ